MTKKPEQPSAEEDRRARSGEALRANLRRRKEQARGKEQSRGKEQARGRADEAPAGPAAETSDQN